MQVADRIKAMTVEVMDNMRPTRPTRMSRNGRELMMKEIDYATEQLDRLQMGVEAKEVVAKGLCTRLLPLEIRNTLPGGLSTARLG